MAAVLQLERPHEAQQAKTQGELIGIGTGTHIV
jgi:hypothetical protein